ncbi:hypothetical protein TWF192_007579 [Orbilia oligospora]|uniref:L-ornithine N(5)-oxygenase n=2 Tax=Orbilia oligospora TaxID=2813651 RepID=A0A6G1M5A1_ORBOL|nr:hypothetical protein TWF679_004712 [Orbilia oligospora]KAF3216550.1 hypothetical protein TWF191_009036 [Orbilia oligospora]KAF3245056.1 hypothetical protein TWF192_007579 [Orbilia oligospora]
MVKRDFETAMVSMGSRGFKSKSTKADMDNGAILTNISTISKTDTVIIGNGPSALALSYLLHGNEPWYSPSEPHPDPVLHRKLLKKFGLSPLSDSQQDVRLYDILRTPKDCNDITCHFPASVSMSYSTAALPLNTLLDTLLRPLVDVDMEESMSRVGWRKTDSDVVPHVILGEEPKAGGQWAGDEVWFGDEDDEESDNGLKTLSYADLLSLPGYSLGDHYKQKYHTDMDPYYRPTRRLVAEYYATYPRKVGIEDVLFPGTSVTNVERINDKSGFNFLVSIKLKSNSGSTSHEAHVIRCRNVVLGTGIFSHRIPPPPVFTPFFKRKLDLELEERSWDNSPAPANTSTTAQLPLLVVGSGYTAADAILCNQGKRPIVHVYRWDPEDRPSPLRGCHPQAYPGYAGVYRQMKDAVLKKKSATNGIYQGFPNAVVAETRGDGTVTISIKSEDGTNKETIIRVADIEVCIGRRGRLDYLAPDLCEEIGVQNLDYSNMESLNNTRESPSPLALSRTVTSSRRYSSRSRKPMLHPTTSDTAGKVWVRYSSLRERVEQNIEVTANVFIIGSLTGDSLVRFAMGGCVYSAGRIISDNAPIIDSSDSSTMMSETSSMSESEDPQMLSEGKARRRKSKCVVV